ncbi:meiosis expressed gene 1 protein homolog isoform X1 [Heteronotia binoei]|uniref:meiosis expressed gene 1 protein homolog isoform X1 n=1 Tax=Heteronotia binoei TaxID=13085 RepID=UPI00292D017B|nr:meiosis expressed gene 1 protein homolog isoform X1 [Heteronotia binoei]
MTPVVARLLGRRCHPPFSKARGAAVEPFGGREDGGRRALRATPEPAWLLEWALLGRLFLKRKLPGDLSGAGADIKPKSIRRAKTWSDEVENLYRFQQAGYRDEIEYKQVKHVSMVERWPETGFVKKLQRRDNTFYYYDKERECEDKEVHKVKVYAY